MRTVSSSPSARECLPARNAARAAVGGGGGGEHGGGGACAAGWVGGDVCGGGRESVRSRDLSQLPLAEGGDGWALGRGSVEDRKSGWRDKRGGEGVGGDGVELSTYFRQMISEEHGRSVEGEGHFGVVGEGGEGGGEGGVEGDLGGIVDADVVEGICLFPSFPPPSPSLSFSCARGSLSLSLSLSLALSLSLCASLMREIDMTEISISLSQRSLSLCDRLSHTLARMRTLAHSLSLTLSIPPQNHTPLSFTRMH